MRGLRARGGFVVDLDWRDGALTKAVVHSDLGNPCVLRAGKLTVRPAINRGASFTFDPKAAQR